MTGTRTVPWSMVVLLALSLAALACGEESSSQGPAPVSDAGDTSRPDADDLSPDPGQPEVGPDLHVPDLVDVPEPDLTDVPEPDLTDVSEPDLVDVPEPDLADLSEPDDGSGEEEPVPQRLTWNDEVSPIFQRRCTGCHGWARTYNGVVGRIDRGTLGPKIQMGHHIGGDDKQMVLDWIDDGYPEE